MARKPMDMPTGVEIHGSSLRIRFTWNGKRHAEVLTLPTTKSGIATAAKLRTEIVGLIKHGLMDGAQYAKHFPNSLQVLPATSDDSFLAFTQNWLDCRPIAEGTKINYKSLMNHYWMPYLGHVPVGMITLTLLQKIVAETKWTSPQVRRAAIHKVRTVLKAAVGQGKLDSNPAELLELPKKLKKQIDPFKQDEAYQIIAKLYATEHWPSLIYAAFYEFVFYTGMRLSEALALRWDAVDLNRREAHVCRTVALGKVEERTKTGNDRVVLLNERAIHALYFAQAYCERRASSKVGRIKEFPYCFPPSKGQPFVKQTSDLHHQWRPTLKELGIRYRPPYNCRHTYATICLMAGMNPAFIAKQLGHSVQMLLDRYAHWIDGENDWAQMEKLQIGPKLAQYPKQPL